MARRLNTVQLTKLVPGTIVTLKVDDSLVNIVTTNHLKPRDAGMVSGVLVSTTIHGVHLAAHPTRTLVPDVIRRDGLFLVEEENDGWVLTTNQALRAITVTDITLY